MMVINSVITDKISFKGEHVYLIHSKKCEKYLNNYS